MQISLDMKKWNKGRNTLPKLVQPIVCQSLFGRPVEYSFTLVLTALNLPMC